MEDIYQKAKLMVGGMKKNIKKIKERIHNNSIKKLSEEELLNHPTIKDYSINMNVKMNKKKKVPLAVLLSVYGVVLTNKQVKKLRDYKQKKKIENINLETQVPIGILLD
jgi:hypothetical protein